MAKFCNRELKPVIMMITAQLSYAIVNVCYKLASNAGMHVKIIVAYRLIFASVGVLPLALYFERNSRPKLTWMVIFQAFICALFGGSLAQNLYAQSLVMTSATFASATTNLIPAFTFFAAIFFRLERFELKTRAGRAKVIGTLICIGGAMFLTFYKGVEIKLWSTHVGLLRNHSINGGDSAKSHRSPSSHILGPILAIASSFSLAFGLIFQVLSLAFGLIFQAKMSIRYPCHYSSTALICLMGALQAVVFALCMERNHWDDWKLKWDVRLLAVAYSGIVASGIMSVITMWCVRMRGPLFVSVFSPLMLVLVAIAGSLFLEEKLHVGSVVGAVVIVCGMYVVLWGNAKEMKRIAQLVRSIEKTEDHQHQLEMPKIGENDKDVNSCNMMAIGVAPNFLPSPEIDAAENAEEDDHHLEEGLPVPKGKV